jgi:hypothetical protein
LTELGREQVPRLFGMSDFDDEIGFHALRDHGFSQTILLLPYMVFCNITSVVRWAGFGPVNYTHHFTGLESITHSNRLYIVILLILEPITFGLGEYSC